MRTTHIKSNVVNNGVPKLPTSDAIYYGEIAINYGASGETLSIKNSNDEIVPFSSDNAINKAFEVHAQSLIDLDGRIVELKDTKVESEEFNKIVSDLNKKLSAASESLDNLYSEIVNLTDKINENEVVISESLCDLDKRIKKIDTSYNNPTLTAITFNSITWVTDIPAKGGTATKDNCTFEVYGKYDNGISVDISSIVTVEGELVVEKTTIKQRHEAGQLTLTASYRGLTATGNVTAYQEAVPDPSMEPLTFNILSAGTINWTASNTAVTKTINYKLNNGEWKSIKSNTGSSAPTITVNSGDKLQFKGNNAQYGTNSSRYNSFSGSTASFEVEGNIMSLIYGDDFKNNLTISSGYTFCGLFRDCTKLVSAENLILPATTLASNCYSYMFNGCTKLTTAPTLPATTLANYCYSYMFRDCTSLTTAPALPATTLADYCYYYMFRGCKNLTTAPELPSTTLASGCYSNMFYNCTKLTTAPELPATDLVDYCYQSMFQGCTSLTTAPELPATNLASYCYNSMFYSCTSLTAAPALPATNLASYCYNSMFYSCTSLTAAPALPATTLANYCYQYMFYGCTSLTAAPKLPATRLVDSCYQYMFYGCTSLTTAPELPATTLKSNCYYYMFYGTNVLPDCSNIDFASSTVVASGGLKGLFSGTKVTDNDLERLLPKNNNGKYYLPVTTLANQCYNSMFKDCKNLTTAPELPATTLANQCYLSMFGNCTSLTTAPELPATTLTDYCYQYMFYSCTSLTAAPELPATDLASSCYANMFNGCASLNYIKCLATNISATNCTRDWANGVSSTGTFVKNPNMASWTTGVNGIPANWTVEEYGDFSTEPLTFNILSAGTINWKAGSTAITKTIDYKLNDGEWTSITSNTGSSAPSITVNSGDKLQFRGNNEQYTTNSFMYNSFSGSTALFEAEGNIMSLIYGDNFKNKLTISSAYTFASLFRDCTKLVSAENLVLPATSLTDYCYYSMFQGCTSLTTAPKLPATTLASNCYNNMFYGTNVLPDCSNIDFASSTVVASGGLKGLFSGTKVTDNDLERLLPKNDNGRYYLPATTLAQSCYFNMFYKCTSLTTAPELPATDLVDYCYQSMFQGCTSLTTAPSVLPATTLKSYCYQNMFNGCTSLTTAPELPATTLASDCYYGMFKGCTSLNYIKCLATSISASDCTSNWVNGVASTGTFVKASSMTSWKTGDSGIPTGWAKQNA